MLARSDSLAATSLAEKVAFLSAASAYPGHAGRVDRRETHMSWLFFVGEAVYKLKKPVRFPYLDFSTVARREAACRAEFGLNQELAPQIYQAVVPLVRRNRGLAIGGEGEVLDWLVVMRRFDPARTLEARLQAGDVRDAELDGLADLLARFYRRTGRAPVSPAAHLVAWRKALADNADILLHSRRGLPEGRIRRVVALQARFLRVGGGLLADRACEGRIVDAHGDLRPEHIWMGPSIKIIDRLEFNARLRAVDPLDEIAFLDLETEMLGAPDAGARVRRRVQARLHDHPPEPLYLFYRSYRAMLRARLAIAHLLEPCPRTPEKWLPQARAYLTLAARDARGLAARLRTPGGR